MHSIILVIHVIIAVCLVGVILMQRSEGGALGGLGGNSMNSLMTGRSVGNLLTRITAILAALFMATSLTLAILARGETVKNEQSFLDVKTAAEEPAPANDTPQVPVSSK